MKLKLIIVSFLVFGCLYGSSQLLFEPAKQTYKAPNLKDSVAKHKIVAILPFHATISYKQAPKNVDTEALKQEEKSLSTNMQDGMYTYLLRKAEDFSVSFQEVSRTNILLKQARVYDSLDLILPDSLCKILKVDAVIKCNYAYQKTSSEAGAIVKTVLFGSAGSKTGSGSLTMQIYNSSDGGLLWRFYKEMNETITSNANEVMERMMRKVARNFPYEK
jgi:hypothetical protein